MHGVPPDLDLAPFVGADLQRVDLGPWIIHLRFSAEQTTEIGIEGHWELRDARGELLDEQMEPSERDCYRLHLLLGQPVTGSEVRPPHSFVLTFERGHTLEVFDRSREYESFSLQPGDYFI